MPMKLKTKILKTIRTPRTKSISTHPSLPTISTHYDGSIKIFNNQNNNENLFQSLKISESPIRASCFYKNNILLGSDFGEITVHDINGLKIKTIKAHNDFIRALDSNEDLFVSCSDDFSIKVFRDYKVVGIMTHNHFVMGVRIKNDLIYSVSLDCSAKVFKVESTSNYYENQNSGNNQNHGNLEKSKINDNLSFICIKTFKDHQSGINNLDIFKNYLTTCGDDHKVLIYEKNNIHDSFKLIHSIVFDRNILSVRFCENFLFCGSEDGVVSVYSIGSFTLEGVLRPNLGRVWAISNINNVGNNSNNNLNNDLKNKNVYSIAIYIGCDEGIQTIGLFKQPTLSTTIRNKIILISNSLNSPLNNRYSIYRLSLNKDQIVSKELMELNDNVDITNISSNSKYIAIENNGIIDIYNYVGFRHKETIKGESICLKNEFKDDENSFKNNNSDFAYLKGDLICYNNLEVKMPTIKKLFFLKDEVFAGITENETIVFKFKDEFEENDLYEKSDLKNYNNDETREDLKDNINEAKEDYKEADLNGDFDDIKIIAKLPKFNKLVFLKNFLFCFSDKISIYNNEFHLINTFNNLASNISVYKDLIFFIKNDHLFYFVVGKKIYLQFVKIEKNQFLGIIDDQAVFKNTDKKSREKYDEYHNSANCDSISNSVFGIVDDFLTFKLDIDFINYQREVLNDRFPSFKINSKAVQFLESLGYYEKILQLIENNENLFNSEINIVDLKFDVLIKLKRYNEAMVIACKNNHYLSLAEIFKDLGEFKKSSLMYLRGGRYDDSFLMFSCSGGKLDGLKNNQLKNNKQKNHQPQSYRKNINDMDLESKHSDIDDIDFTKCDSIDNFLKKELPGKISGILQFIVDYQNREFEKCSDFLRDTEFYELFIENHFKK